MPYDQQLGDALSATFRATCSTRLNQFQLNGLENLLLQLFAVRNIRNAQLWTRFGTQTRRFIRPGLPELELDTRAFFADRFIQNVEPGFPVKQKPFLMPLDNQNARTFFNWINDSWIRNFCTRIYCEGLFIIIEYAADSDTEVEQVDLDSEEFEDVLED